MYIILGKILKNLQAEAVRLRTISTELTQEVKEKMRAEDFCVNEGQWATKKLLELLRRSHGWVLPGIINVMAEIAEPNSLLITKLNSGGHSLEL
jgi:hypothetical protein